MSTGTSLPVTAIHRGTLQGASGNIEMLRVTVKADHEWAIVHVDSSYLLTVKSTYGDWSYKWYSIDGDNFTAWLLQCDDGYMKTKFNQGGDLAFMIDKTVDGIKRNIIQLRRKRKIASVDARDMWDEADEIDDLTDFWRYQDSDLPGRDCEDCLVMEYPQGLQNFMAEQWPLVRQCLQTVVAEFGE